MGRSKKSTKSTPCTMKIPPRMFNHSPDIILIVDKKQRVLFMNRAMEGYRPKHMIGHNSAKLFPQTIRSWYRHNLTQVFKDAQEHHFQYSTDQSTWWEIRLAAISRGKQVVEAMIHCTDVTEKKMLHAQAIRHARLATIGILATSVAHEINNPNSAILFNASVISRALADSQPILEEYYQKNGDFLLGDMGFADARTTIPTLLNDVIHNTRRVKLIVDNLKHLAKRDAEDLKGEDVDIHTTLQASIMILNHKIRRHTDHFEFTPGKHIPTLHGNSPQLEQVFINVILNALQSLPNRTKAVKVWTERDASQEYILIFVQDEGEGIAQEHIARLSEPFFTTRLASGGTGLGLSISNLILQQHHASIHFESQPGEGTKVTIRIPRTPPQFHENQSKLGESQQKSDVNQQETAAQPPKPH